MRMKYMIQAVGFANGVPCPHENEWLASFDHDADGGLGFGTFTSDPEQAMRFQTKVGAMLFWRKQSTVRPTRPDGQPNRPLTALTIAIVEDRWS